MPSLILTGHPSSGKTTFAKLLAERAVAHKSSIIHSVVIINESSARPDKTIRECYSNSTEEKLTRGALKTEFDKYVKDPTKLVILDSMNYIKGFRYELHCISKSAGQKHGVIWILNREDVTKAWNDERSKLNSSPDVFYTQEMMDELMARYEPPDERNRWDRPLYRVDVHSTLEDSVFETLGLLPYLEEGEEEVATAGWRVLNRSVYNMHSLSDVLGDSTVMNDSQWSQLDASVSVGDKSKYAAGVPTTISTVASVPFQQRKTIGSSFKRTSLLINKQQVPQQRVQQQQQQQQQQQPLPDRLAVDQTGRKDEGMDSSNAVLEDQQSATKAVAPSDSSPCHRRERNVKKMEDLIDAILDSFLLDVEPLKAGISTTIQRSADSNVLHDVDVITQNTMNAFLSAQKSISEGGGKILVNIGSSGKTRALELKRVVQFSEMKRLRRQYIKWSSVNPPTDTSQEGISNAFLSYVQNQL